MDILLCYLILCTLEKAFHVVYNAALDLPGFLEEINFRLIILNRLFKGPV